MAMRNKLLALLFILCVPLAAVVYSKVSAATGSELLGVVATLVSFVLAVALLIFIGNLGQPKEDPNSLLNPKNNDSQKQ